MAIYTGPIGPSRPGYQQGTAGNVTSSGQYVGPIGPSLPNQVQGTAGNLTNSPAPAGGGGNSGGGSSGTPQPPSGPSQQELNAAYDPLLSYLGQAESQLRSDYPTYQQDINNAADTSKQVLGNNYNSTTQQLSNQGDQGAKQKDNVIAAAQRLYQELQQSNLQRFGAGGTGQFASELQGRELQHNTSTAQGQYTDLVQQLGQKKIEVDAQYQTGLKQIEDQRQSAINQVNRDFQDKLSQINQQRGAVESQKAQQRLDALQQYRNQVYAIQLQNYQLQQTAQSNYTAQTSQLQQYAEKISQSGQAGTDKFNTYNQNAVTNPQSQYNPQAYNPQATPDYTGQISPSQPKRNIYDLPSFNPQA